MISNYRRILTFVFLMLFVTIGRAADKPGNCHGFGGMSEFVCTTSHIQIITNPKIYEGKMVDFQSVVHRNSKTEAYLYPSNEYRKVGVVADAIRLDESAHVFLDKYGVDDGGWIRVVGRFRQKDDVEFQRYLGVVSDVFLLVPVGQYKHLFDQAEENEQFNKELD